MQGQVNVDFVVGQLAIVPEANRAYFALLILMKKCVSLWKILVVHAVLRLLLN